MKIHTEDRGRARILTLEGLFSKNTMPLVHRYALKAVRAKKHLVIDFRKAYGVGNEGMASFVDMARQSEKRNLPAPRVVGNEDIAKVLRTWAGVAVSIFPTLKEALETQA